MKEIILNSTPIENGIQEYQQIFNGKIIDENTIELDNDLAKGFINFFKPNNNLILISSEITIKNNFTIIRKAEEGPWLAFRYFISSNDLSVKQLETDNEISLNSINSILATSQHFEKKIVLKKGIEMKYVSIFINKNWLADFLPKTESEKHKTIYDPKKPLYRYSNINSSIYGDLEELFDKNKQRSPAKELLNISLLYRLIYKTINRIFSQERNLLIPNQKDIQTLFQIRKILLNSNKDYCPKLEELAHEAGMSISKFSKLFKTVFGKTLNLYRKELQMKKALNLLITGDYSVSEVCDILGYKNQSKFSSTFNSYFGILPRQVISKRQIKQL